ncbi:MAG: 4Fe-4S dicluster domain-containing protein, partial [Desulfobacterales bacterium]
ADEWLACRPGGEAVVALGIVREALQQGRGDDLPRSLRKAMGHIASDYSLTRVSDMSGISQDRLKALQETVLSAKKPLVLGSGSANGTLNGTQTDLAANVLNWILDPELSLLDFSRGHRVAEATPRSAVETFWSELGDGQAQTLLLNNVNPLYSMPPGSEIASILQRSDLFVVSFSNFMDETTQLANLVLPVKMALETWDEYGGQQGLTGLQQPALGKLYDLPSLGDLLLACVFGDRPPAPDYKQYLINELITRKQVARETDWIEGLQRGGWFPASKDRGDHKPRPSKNFSDLFLALKPPQADGLALMAAPSIRFHDGRGANRPWLAEIPDPVTRIAWQTPVWIHPETLEQRGLAHGDGVQIVVDDQLLEAPAYATQETRPNVLVVATGQGHSAYGRYAAHQGANPFRLLPSGTQIGSGAPQMAAMAVALKPSGKTLALAHTDGSREQYERTIALSTPFAEEGHHDEGHAPGLIMEGYPLTLPLAEGYRKDRDFYPPHAHDTYRWAMTVDLDRCIGCGACAAACYAENNVGIVGAERIAEGREMAWLSIDRYHDQTRPEQLIFIPMLCQHCDNAPCESVCPVYAPHHNKEGMNNQIYNRCIGTRFCSQNCPYKVRRFNWFAWQWPGNLKLQLNPSVTVRAKGVMEKCSFCIQRIKAAHSVAKNEQRQIRDGEVVPACVQTCPTQALTFGNLMDRQSRVRKQTEDPRAYQVMGYLNTKPAVIYLKKVVHTV